MEEGCAQGLRTQAIDETRSQYPKTDPLTLPSAVNCKLLSRVCKCPEITSKLYIC